MKLRLLGGPMNGALYVLSRDRPEPSTNRKPDGLWFDGQDGNGSEVRPPTIWAERWAVISLKYGYSNAN